MDASDRPEGFTLKSKGQYKFEFICTRLTRRRGVETAPVKEIPSDDVCESEDCEEDIEGYCAVRLAVKGNRVWYHNTLSDKHRIAFCTSDNVNLVGLGLRVHQDITRVVASVCQMYGGINHQGLFAVFSQTFNNVPKEGKTSILKFYKSIQISCDEIYAIVLDVHGGASFVGEDGEEFVAVQTLNKQILFKFDEFPHNHSNKNKMKTNVEIGLIEKLYFTVDG